MKLKLWAGALLLAWAGATGAALQLTSPCKTEDSVMCYWDSSTRGNGLGHSFISLTETLKVRTS